MGASGGPGYWQTQEKQHPSLALKKMFFKKSTKVNRAKTLFFFTIFIIQSCV